MGEPLSWSPFFNEIAGINSRLATLVKKSLHQRHLPVNILELLAFSIHIPKSVCDELS